MRRFCGVLACVCFFLCLNACREERSVTGIWLPLEPSAYYFELFDDGTCMMFDDEDAWVSSGTYQKQDTHITFKTDTGSFIWIWDEESESMLFESADGVWHYRLKENKTVA